MDVSSLRAPNIVATAMSTANLSPDSPKVSNGSSLPGEASPQASLPHPVGSPSQHGRSSPMKIPSTESMEVTINTTTSRTLTKQHSQDSDSLGQRSMEVTHNAPTTSVKEEDLTNKTVVLRTEGKDPHLVTVTPPAPFPSTSINNDTRMQQQQQHLLIYNPSSEKQQLITTIPLSIQLLTKPELGDSEMRPKPKEDATYPITCGNNRADLVWKKFICPGINAKCVKYGDNWFTPKEFVNYAGKSTLKDWKRAIRINGIMLRKMIENGELNYYDHENNCSNQCRSNKQSSFDNSCEKPYNSFESETREMSREPSMENGNGPIRSSSEDLTHFNARRNPLASAHNKSQESASGNSLERSSSEDSGLASSPHLEGVLMREASVTMEKMQDLLGFWNGIIRMDAFDDIIREVLTQITALHSKTKQAGSMTIEDAATMTNLVNSLEMIPSIANKMSAHKHKVEKETEESSQAIQELERKLAEQKKYEQDLKRKSQHLDNVISLTPTEKRKKRNIIRIGRQKAVDSRIPPGVISGSSSTSVPTSLRENAILAASGRIAQRDLWPQAIQVDGPARAASSQMARMNVSGSRAEAAAISAGMPSFTIFPPPSIHHPSAEVFASSSLQQAFINSQAALSTRDTQSPKK